MPPGAASRRAVSFAAAKMGSFLPAAALSTATDYFMGLAGVIIVGHFVGASALAALNLLLPVVCVTSFFTLWFAMGTSVLFATEIGRFDRARAHAIFTQGFVSVLGTGMLLMALCHFGADAFLAYCGASADVTAGAKAYLRAFLPALVLCPLSGFFTTLALADGDEKLASLANGVKIVVLLATAIPLTIGFGLQGCAVGVGLSAFASVAVLVRHFFRPGGNWRLVRHFSWRDLGRICGCSFGDASVDLCTAGIVFLVNAHVVSHYGTERLAVLSVLFAALGVEKLFDIISTALQPLATTYIGERNAVRTAHVMNVALALSLALGVILTVVLLACPDLVIWLIGMNDPSLLSSARLAVRIASIGLVGVSVVMLFNSYYMYIGRSRLATTLTLISCLVAQLVLYPVMARVWGETGLWLALSLAPYVALVAMALIVRAIGGRANFPYFLDRARLKELRVFDLVLEPAAICAASREVAEHLKARGVDDGRVARAALLVEETLMVVRDRNRGKRLRAEVTVDFGGQGVALVIRDDGEIFDITDADAQISSLRTYLVSNLMGEIRERRNLTATGFNRNVFVLHDPLPS